MMDSIVAMTAPSPLKIMRLVALMIAVIADTVPTKLLVLYFLAILILLQ